LHYIGKIDVNKVGQFACKLVTLDVILTDERANHIKQKHFNDYNLILKKLDIAVLNPNLVLKDNNNDNTLMFIKKLNKNNLNVVVKLSTYNDRRHPKNSVMTAWIIRNSNLKKIKEKNTIIYKSE